MIHYWIPKYCCHQKFNLNIYNMNLIILLLQAAQSNDSILDLIIIFCIWLHSTTPIIANPCHHNFWNLVLSTHPCFPLFSALIIKTLWRMVLPTATKGILWWNVVLYLCDYGKSLLTNMRQLQDTAWSWSALMMKPTPQSSALLRIDKYWHVELSVVILSS